LSAGIPDTKNITAESKDGNALIVGRR